MTNYQPDAELVSWAQRLQSQSARNRHRACIILSGSADWLTNSALSLIQNFNGSDSVWISNDVKSEISELETQQPIKALTVEQSRHQLGQEFEMVIFDCQRKISANGLGAIAGTIKAGGLMILLAPSFASWGISKAASSRYIERLKNIISSSNICHLVSENEPLPAIDINILSPSATQYTDQQAGIDAILKAYQGKRRRPAVLVSDRGRGKSAALGIATKILIDQGARNIVVTGLNEASVATVFKHAELSNGNNNLQFLSAQALIDKQHDIDFLLVDEAASIPVHQLQILLQRYPRIAFASTVHGYEGTGRGFNLNFTRILDDHSRGWHFTRLYEPVRWASHDPLEAFVFECLMLDAEPNPAVDSPDNKTFDCENGYENPAFQEESLDNLVEDEHRLRQIFGLLSLAHYQTRPSDLQVLLDGANNRLFTISLADAVVGVTLVSLEKPMADDIAKKVWKNQRRPKSSPTIELLCAQLGILESSKLSIARVVRIAVHPELKRKHLGTTMISQLEMLLSSQVDVFASTFSMSEDILAFWNSLGFQPARIGVTKSTSTANHNATLLKPISPAGNRVAGTAHNLLQKNLPELLASELTHVSPEIVTRLYAPMPESRKIAELSATEFANLVRFAFYDGNEDVIRHNLKSLTIDILSSKLQSASDTSEQERHLLIEHILQNKPWESCSTISGSEGKKQGLALLRKSVRRHLESYYATRLEQFRS